MRFHYSKNEDALYIRFNENPYAESEEVQEGIIFDYDAKKKIIGIEILDASEKLPVQFKRDIIKRKIPFTITEKVPARAS